MNLSKVQILLAWILGALAGKSFCVCVWEWGSLDISPVLAVSLGLLLQRRS